MKNGNSFLITALNITPSDVIYSGTPVTTALSSTLANTDPSFTKHSKEMPTKYNDGFTDAYLTSSKSVNMVSNNTNTKFKDMLYYESNVTEIFPHASPSTIFAQGELTYSHVASESTQSIHITPETKISTNSLLLTFDVDSTQTEFEKPTNQWDAGTTEIIISSGVTYSKAHGPEITEFVSESTITNLPEYKEKTTTALAGFTSADESNPTFSKFISSNSIFLALASTSTVVINPVSLCHSNTSTDSLPTSRNSLPQNHASQRSTDFSSEIKLFTKPTTGQTSTNYAYNHYARHDYACLA